jgi:hypothetical protein
MVPCCCFHDPRPYRSRHDTARDLEQVYGPLSLRGEGSATSHGSGYECGHAMGYMLYYNVTVERAELYVADIAISDEKAAYIEAAKGVTAADVREVLGNQPRFGYRALGPRYARSQSERPLSSGSYRAVR